MKTLRKNSNESIHRAWKYQRVANKIKIIHHLMWFWVFDRTKQFQETEKEKTPTQKKLENYFGKNAKDNGKTMVHFRFEGSAIIVITLSVFLLVYQNEMDTFSNNKKRLFSHSNLLWAKILSQPSSHKFKQREEKTCPQPTSINEADGARVYHCLLSWCHCTVL